MGEVLTPPMIDVAGQACGAFETGLFGRHDPRFRLRPRADKWLSSLVDQTTSQGPRQPDEWRYRFTVDAFEQLAHADSGTTRTDLETGIEPDIHAFFLIQWLGSSATRYRYCDDAVGAVGAARSTMDLLGRGQVLERREIFRLTWEAVEVESANPRAPDSPNP